MKVAYDLAIDRLSEPELAPEPAPEPAQPTKALASWYAPGLSDEIGDRLLMFDNSSAPSLELLRFRRALTATPGFELALRRRVERLRGFRHPSFATVRSVECLGHGHGPALLSNYTPGRRLSEVIQNVRGPAFATALIEQLAPALASLRQHDDGTGHGALAASRIVITPEGRLVIVEHVLGSALFQLSTSRLGTELGIAVPRSRATDLRLDIQTDYFQLGLIALSLLVGRRLSADESHETVARLLQEVARTADRESPVLFRRLRLWLERALQLRGQVFESSAEAEAEFNSLSDAGATRSALQRQPVRAILAQDDASLESSLPVDPRTASRYDVRPEVSAQASEPRALSDMVSPTLPQNATEATEAVLPRPPTVDSVGSPMLGPDAAVPDPELQVPVQELDQRGAILSGALDASESLPYLSEEPVCFPSEEPVSEFVPGESVSEQKDQHARIGSSLFIEINPGRLRSNIPIRDDNPAPRGREKHGGLSIRRRSLSAPQFLTRSLSGFISGSKRFTDRRESSPGKTQKGRRRGTLPSLAAVLALCVVAEGFVIARLLQRPPAVGAPLALLVESVDPGADVVVDGQSAGFTPLQLTLGADTRSIRVVDSRPPRPDASARQPANRPAPPAKPEVRTADVVAASPQRSGGIRLLSPFDVEVFQGDKRLGSSATGIVSAPAGRHEWELVNSRLGYRARRTVDVKGGHVVSVSVSPPNGRLSINALPWAEVWIDGKFVGETPLANLTVPLGEHEIIFRHPQLAEQRQTALVRQEGVTRVSANLQR